MACVALVDDEAPVRSALGRLLRLADHAVLAFASGEEFLLSLQTRLPDCVLLDVHMPGLDGLAVQRQMRTAGHAVPVVVITASDDAAIERGALAGGACCVLRKPFSSAQLLGAVGAAMDGGAGRLGPAPAAD